MSFKGFQYDAFQGDAFQTCVEGFQSDAFQDDAFQMCVEPVVVVVGRRVFFVVPDPYTTDFQRWTAELIYQDPTIPFVFRPEDWRRWASEVAGFSSLRSLGVPDPQQFDDWRHWGARLRDVTQAGT